MDLRAKQDIFVVGAGYAGMFLALSLASEKRKVILVSPYPYHELTAEIYEVLHHENIQRTRVDIELLIQKKNIELVIDKLEKIDSKNFIFSKLGVIPKDKYIWILSTGLSSKPENNFRTAEDAFAVVEKIKKLNADSHIEIVGAGTTAIELAAHIHDRFQEEGLKTPRFTLVSMLDNGKIHLPKFSKNTKEKIEEHLRIHRVYLRSERVKDANLSLFATGLNGASFDGFESPIISQDYELEKNIYVAGDLTKKNFPLSAQGAILQGELIRDLILEGKGNLRSSLGFVMRLPGKTGVGTLKTPLGQKEFINPLMPKLKQAALLRYRVNLFRLSQP